MSSPQTTDINDYITQLIQKHDVVIFMKGTADLPVCGFSATVAAIFKRLNIPFHAEDILKSEELRSAIKTYTNWPTLPQVYIKGQFIGGCDIVRDMMLSGELEKLLEENQIVATSFQ